MRPLVLVAYATACGSTREVAGAVGGALRTAGLEVDVWPVQEVVGMEGYDAVVLGSAVYVGHWLDAARRFARHQESALTRRPLWLFSSGPVGDPAVPADEAAEVPELVERLGAQAHRTFAGRLRLADLALVERAAVRCVHANEGDFRDWPAIRAWARDIAETLSGSEAIVESAPDR